MGKPKLVKGKQLKGSRAERAKAARQAAGASSRPIKHPKPRLPSIWTTLGQAWRYDRAMRRALAHRGAGPLDGELVQDILTGLGDNSLKADDPFVTTTLEAAANATGPVLQCGAGPMTVLLAMTMQRRSQYLWCLEHSSSTAATVRSQLARYDIRAGQVVCAPAEAFGDHIWYVLDVKHLPRGIGLVVCDGSNVLPNGMRGVVRRLERHLDQRCVVLVRNTNRPKDLDFAAKWAKAKGAPFILNDKAEPFVKIALRNQASASELASDRVLTVYGDVDEPKSLCQNPADRSRTG